MGLQRLLHQSIQGQGALFQPMKQVKGDDPGIWGGG
jgi:hypothetical protein